MTLDAVRTGDTAFITDTASTDDFERGERRRRRLAELGLVPGTAVTVLRRAPSGDPMEISQRGYRLSLRARDAALVSVTAREEDAKRIAKSVRPWDPPRRVKPRTRADSGTYAGGDERSLTVALVGNPNCGKTTLYNLITGSDRRVGNFPGITVDVASGVLHRRYAAEARVKDVRIVDLPGVYSLAPYSDDERLAVRFLADDRPDAIINVVDATSPERGLYLTTQLAELGIPTVIAFNMTDEVRRQGGSVDVAGIGDKFGMRAVGISASHGEGIVELIDAAAAYALEPALTGGCESAVIPNAAAEYDIKAIAERYAFVDGICRKYIMQTPKKLPRADRVILGRYTAYPILFAVVALIFYLTFNVIGRRLSDALAAVIDMIGRCASDVMEAADVHPLMIRLLRDGVLAGVGAVVSFLPLVVTLFFFLSLLEDTGYLSRAAFIMDAPMRKLGLSGKSVVPLLFGFGCSVPAILAARTLPDERDRRLTAVLVPYMSCSAKIPIYAMLAGAFFPDRAPLVICGFYALGIGAAAVFALISKICARSAPEPEYMLELPPWRLPTLRGVLRPLRRKTSEFLSRAFGVIFLSSVAVWVLSTFDTSLSVAADAESSILAAVGRIVAPILSPLGFGDWRAAAALIAGLSAKEAVIGTLAVLLGSGEGMLAGLFCPASALSFMMFTLLYTPCAASVAALRGELGGVRRTLRVLVVGMAVAYAASFAVYRIALMFL